MFAKSVDIAKENGYIKEGDLVVFTAGLPLGIPGSTNMLKVHTVGEILAKGTGIGKQSVSGKAVIVESAAEALEKMAPGNILITKSLKAELVPALKLSLIHI